MVKRDLLDLLREELGQPTTPETGEESAEPGPEPAKGDTKTADRLGGIPTLAKRLTRVNLKLEDLKIAKTGNLQPYLFKVLQEQDAGADLVVTIEVKSGAGIPEDILDSRIVEGLEQLGIQVR